MSEEFSGKTKKRKYEDLTYKELEKLFAKQNKVMNEIVEEVWLRDMIRHSYERHGMKPPRVKDYE